WKTTSSSAPMRATPATAPVHAARRAAPPTAGRTAVATAPLDTSPLLRLATHPCWGTRVRARPRGARTGRERACRTSPLRRRGKGEPTDASYHGSAGPALEPRVVPRLGRRQV